MTDIAILPLALTVMLGPQILVAILLITRKDPVKSSLVYIVAVMLTLLLTTSIYYLLANIINFQSTSEGGRPILKYILIALCVYLLVKSILNRHKLTEPPKWMKEIHEASLSKIFILGFTLIAFMPTDIVVAFTVGSLLNNDAGTLLDALPFFGAVLLIAFIPLILYFSLGSKGPEKLEKANVWLNTHGYVINVAVLTFFIFMML